MNYEAVSSAMAQVGLSDPRVLANSEFTNAEELVRLLFPEAESQLTAEDMAKVQARLDQATGAAALHNQVLKNWDHGRPRRRTVGSGEGQGGAGQGPEDRVPGRSRSTPTTTCSGEAGLADELETTSQEAEARRRWHG